LGQHSLLVFLIWFGCFSWREQVSSLRDLMENYPSSDCDSSFCDQAVSPSVAPEYSFEVVTPFHCSPQDDYLHSKEKVWEENYGG